MKMCSELETYPKDFFFANKVIASICGLWQPSKNYGFLVKIFYFLYCALLYVIAISFLICEFVRFSETVKHTAMLLNHIGLFVTHLVGITKYAYLIIYKDRIQGLIDSLHDQKYFYGAYKDFSPGKFFTKKMRICSFFAYGTFISYSAIGVISHITGKMKMLKETEDGQFAGNQTCYDYLSFMFEIPFSAHDVRMCEYALAYMSAGMGIYAFIIALFDGMFVTLTSCLSAHIVILCNVLKTVRPRCLLKLDLPDNLELFKDEHLPRLEEQMYKDITKCSNHLLVIFKARDDIEDVNGLLILLQSVASMIVIASSLFVSIKVPLASPEFLSQSQYGCNILLQLFLICYFGNEITVSSERISSAVYESDWYSASPRFKKSIILTMCRMQKNIFVTAFKFSPLTLTSFVAVVRHSFSYLAVFQTM